MSGERPPAADEAAHAREIVRMIAAQGRIGIEERRRIAGVLFPELNPATILRFGVMMALSVAIAVMGLSANSAAVVIGAMLVAPLMNPILSFAAAVGLGLPKRATAAAAQVTLGSAGAVVLAALLAGLLPAFDLESEILSRTSPDVRDLIVAFAAGAAGSYATARRDLSSALPGVAVAVALVPPLATVGITFQAGRTDLAEGALLLYATNLVVIVVTSLAVFLVTGVIPTVQLCLENRRLTAVIAVAVVAVVAIGVPLTDRSVAAARVAQRRESVEAEVMAWIGDRKLDVDHVDVDGDRVTVDLAGPDEPAEAFQLAQALTDEIGASVEVEVRWAQRAQGVARADQVPEVGSPEVAVREAALAWLAGAAVDGVEFELLAVDVRDDDVELVVGGPVAPPVSSTLADDVASVLGRAVSITTRWVQSLEDGGDEASPEEQVERLATAWIGARNGVRLLQVQVDDDQVYVDLAVTGPPLGLAVLESLVAGVVGDDAVVTVRDVRLEPTAPSPTDRVGFDPS